jgi:hypothetical protein
VEVVMVTADRIDVTVSGLAGSCRGTARWMTPELRVLFGRVGLVLGALLALFVGNPQSGLNSAPELPPTVWGQLGQFLPQGANATLLHSTAYFDGAAASTAITVLTCWAMVGSLIIVIATHRRSFQIARGPGGSIPQGHYLDRLNTQRNLFASRAVHAACEPAPIDVPATGHWWRDIAESRGRMNRDVKTS